MAAIFLFFGFLFAFKDLLCPFEQLDTSFFLSFFAFRLAPETLAYSFKASNFQRIEGGGAFQMKLPGLEYW